MRIGYRNVYMSSPINQEAQFNQILPQRVYLGSSILPPHPVPTFSPKSDFGHAWQIYFISRVGSNSLIEGA